LSRTTNPSISTNSTLPPSAMRYGRTCARQAWAGTAAAVWRLR
jgi:hypothetical protein